MDRAYAILHVKTVDSERRVISGIATTPEPDRAGDIIEPLGVTFTNPLPLLLFHDTHKPVGFTTFDKPTKTGIGFQATIPTIDEPGTLKDRVDEAWQSVKSGLVSGVSIGFRAIEHAFMEESGGIHFLKTEVMELSLVTIPANASATIHSIKQFDLAASGRSQQPGDSGVSTVVQRIKDAPRMTIPEQITSFEHTRAAKSARMVDLMTKTEGQTLDAAQNEEYDTLSREVKSIDEHLVRLHDLEKSLIAKATPITTTTTSTVTASELRGGQSVVTVKANVPKGTAFTRYVMAKIAGKNSISDAIRYVEQNQLWMDQTPEVLLALKAAVNPGTIAEPAWAAPLAVARPMQNEFLELLRPETLLGKITGMRSVPFNISIPVQTGGGTYNWVGEGAPKPVGNLQFVSVTLGITKAAGIIVISEELAKISSPSAESTVSPTSHQPRSPTWRTASPRLARPATTRAPTSRKRSTC
jgi:HK97 family phage prohead protease